MRHSRSTTFIILIALATLAAAPQPRVDHPGLKKLNWQLAGRASTFDGMTTFEMIDLLHEMNFHHIELSPGQTLSPDHRDVKMDPSMPAQDVDALMNKLKEVKMDIVSYGVADFGANEADARKVFEFGKKLKLKTIVTDAPPESLETLDKLATEYNVNIALTSATTARRYLTCDVMLVAMKGRSDHIGICADLVAWQAAGMDAAQCAKTLGEHVKLLHLSNVDAQGKPAPLGEGKIDVAAVMNSLHDAKFKGICCVQDESDTPEKRLDEFAKSVSALSDIVTKIASSD